MTSDAHLQAFTVVQNILRKLREDDDQIAIGIFHQNCQAL
jgi:hypothetical protein